MSRSTAETWPFWAATCSGVRPREPWPEAKPQAEPNGTKGRTITSSVISFFMLNHKQRIRQAAHLFLQTRIWVGFLARGLVCKRCWIRLAVNRILNFGFRVELMFKTFGRLNVKQGHWDLRVWYDLTQYIIQGHESILVGEIEGVAFRLVYHVCVDTNEVCKWGDCEKWVKIEKEVRGGGEKRRMEYKTLGTRALVPKWATSK